MGRRWREIRATEISWANNCTFSREIMRFEFSLLLLLPFLQYGTSGASSIERRAIINKHWTGYNTRLKDHHAGKEPIKRQRSLLLALQRHTLVTGILFPNLCPDMIRHTFISQFHEGCTHVTRGSGRILTGHFSQKSAIDGFYPVEKGRSTDLED